MAGAFEAAGAAGAAAGAAAAAGADGLPWTASDVLVAVGVAALGEPGVADETGRGVEFGLAEDFAFILGRAADDELDLALVEG